MTDPDPDATGSEPRQSWLHDIQDALERTGDAIRTAWDATRESRASALESAKQPPPPEPPTTPPEAPKQAAEDPGHALEKGIAAARERWKGEEGDAPGSDEPQ